jgi:hypothetical protein
MRIPEPRERRKIEMDTNKISLRWTFLALAALLLTTLLSACSFNPNNPDFDLCEEFDNLALTPVSGDPPAVVFEDPGTIKVMHGSGHARRTDGQFIRVEQSAELPDYANQATVFLNGWDLSYAGSDHHVAGLGTLVARIRVEPRKLTWNAVGVLADKHRDKACNWTYYYTIVAWNDANLHAMVDHNDAESYCKTEEADGSDNFFQADNSAMSTALSCFPSFLSNSNFSSGRTVAVIPRGFGFKWSSGDHHLLQLGYNLESSGGFIQSQGVGDDLPYYKALNRKMNPLPTPPTARAGSGFVSWNSYAIMKDDEGRRRYFFAEVVSGMGGSDVSIIQPAFSIQPSKATGVSTGQAGVKTEEVVIDNIPYRYAIPMLTGWDIGSLGSDEHVKQIGIWIDEIKWMPGDPTGTLRYKVSSVVRDNDTVPANYFRHKVTILGLGPATGVKIK